MFKILASTGSFRVKSTSAQNPTISEISRKITRCEAMYFQQGFQFFGFICGSFWEKAFCSKGGSSRFESRFESRVRIRHVWLLISQRFSIKITSNLLHNITATCLTGNCNKIYCSSISFSVIEATKWHFVMSRLPSNRFWHLFSTTYFSDIIPKFFPVVLCIGVIEWR